MLTPTAERAATINLRARQSDRDLIDRAALANGKNRSEFMLEAACEKAQEVLLDRVFFRVDEARFHEFAARLDAPVVMSAGLAALLSRTAPWDKA